jgi:hypothetical protein
VIRRQDDFWTRRRVKEGLPYGERPIPEIPPPPFTGQTFSGAYVTVSSQTVATASSTRLSFSVESFDTGDYWDSGEPDRFNIVTAGKYLMIAHASFNTNATGRRVLWFEVWGGSGTELGMVSYPPVANGFATIISSSIIVNVSANQEYSAWVYQDSGSDRSVGGGFQIWKVG